jgi:spore germination protein PB
MNITVHQQITIQTLRVGSVSNSSVLQIGAAGVIKALSNLYNTGGFTAAAPTFETPNPVSLVPLPAPSR